MGALDRRLEAWLDEPAPRRAFADAVRAFEQAAHEVAVRAHAERPRWARELDVAFPCSADEARRAFRRLALRVHPDRPGGSHDAFVRAQGWLDEALAHAGGRHC